MILIGYVFFDIRSGHKIFPFYHIKVITESGSVQAQDIGELELHEGIRTINVIEMLSIPDTEIALIFIKNVHAGLDALLKNSDTLALFLPVGGG